MAMATAIDSSSFRELAVGTLTSSAVTTIGIAVLGNDLNESVQFDSLSFQTVPTLFIQQSGNGVVLSWLTGFSGYALQSTTDLSQPNGWAPVANPVSTLNGVSQVTVPVSDSQKFFRLAK
jgi:hypothetical protein